MNPYSEIVQEHYRHPRNFGALEKPDIRHELANPLCGDRVRIEVALADDGRVRAARFQGDLCSIAKAAASLLTELIVGRTLDALPDEQQLVDALRTELKPSRRKCALLPLDALRAGADAFTRR
ncbi:MAG: iron-sulfur cluster assembly scaffold protein [Acidobacteria bacterium]|nr:iron-sulfur cluster assembly scaffold protein [Acidobacteriota bacterium]